MKQENYREFLCGYGAAAVSIGITFPLNKIIFRQMLHGVGVRSAVEQLKSEGFFSLYRGVLPPLMQKSVSTALMFGTFDQIYRHLCQYTSSPPSLVVHYAFIWLSAATSAGVECALVPFERIQTLLQDPEHHSRFQNTFHVAKKLYPYGLHEYYRGMTAVYVRNVLSTGLFFSLREPIADRALEMFQRYSYCRKRDNTSTDRNNRSHAQPAKLAVGAAHFTSGALLGAALSTIFYPTNVIRTRMQSYVGGEFHSILEAWRLIRIERRSFLDTWRGVALNFSRSLISWGIINAAYELLKTVYFQNPSSKSSTH